MAEVVARGLRFHVQRLGGDDRPVVFLHGLVMDNLSSWYFTVANAAAARNLDVLLYDLRGHGKSERPASGYGVPHMVADLHAVLEALEIRAPVRLVGNSFGGLLALAYAAAHPERAAGLVLVDAHLSDDAWGGQMAQTLELEGEARNRMIAQSFKSWLGRHSERKRTRLARTAEALVKGTTLIADLRDSPPLDAGDLARIRCPVLAIYGEHSDLRHRAADLEAALPRCDVRIFPGCTHSVLWEATAEVRELIVAWLARSV